MPYERAFCRKGWIPISLFEKGQEVKSDQNGVALIKIEKIGMQLSSALHKVPAAENSGLNHHMYTTFCNFEVK